jgi:hypothetical protein
MSKKSLMLDDENSEWAICTKSVGYKHPKTGKYRIHPKKQDEFESCKRKVKKKLKEESISENKIVSLIKEKENPRMTKKDLIEYVKSKNVVKKIKKEDMIFEQRRDRGITDFARWFEPRERRILNAYLIKLRDSGLENMFGVAPILNWTKDDLERYLYGKRMDLESLESHGDYEDYWDGDEDDDTERNDEQIEIIRYLLEKKQEIRDILIRAALRRAEADGGEYSDSRITSYFHQAASDALLMYMSSFG